MIPVQELLLFCVNIVKPVAVSIIFCTMLELLTAKEKHSFKSRVLGFIGWGRYFLALPIVWVLQKYIPLPSPLIHFSPGIIAPIVSLFISDFFYYWFHRFQHKIPLLWKFHSVHHSITEINALNSYHHWTEDIIRFLLVGIPLNALIKVDFGEVLAIFVVLQGWGIFIHANTKLNFGKFRIIFADTDYHRLHHSAKEEHFDKNFAAFFPVWDFLFKSLKLPKKGERIRTGLS